MRHGESVGDDAAVADVDDDAATGPVLPPSIDNVRRRAGGHVANAALLHSKAIEVAAILRREPGNEARLPDGLERVRRAQCRQA